jgi:hypothetical protein
MAIPDEVQGLRAQTGLDGGRFLLTLANAERVPARAVVIATGAQYRRLEVDHLADFEGSSVHYWASPLEGRLCAGQEVALVGAGNSAGQAAVYLSSEVAKVWLIVRGPSLDMSMSRYLVDRIAATPNIEVLTQTVVTALEGQGGILEAINYRPGRSGDEVRRAIHHLFLFIGAEPCTEWLSESGVTLDDKGFVHTGANISKLACRASSRSATCALDRSSALPQQLAKVRRWSPRFTPILPKWVPSLRSPSAPEDCDVRGLHPCRRHPQRDAKRSWLRGVPEDRVAVASFALMPDLRPCRLLR